MRINDVLPSHGPINVFQVEHEGKTVEFQGDVYYKAAISPYPLFAELNAYFAQLAPMRQQAIFGTYAAAKAVWDVLSAEPNSNGKVLTSIGAILVKQLYDQLNYSQLGVRLLNDGKLNHLMEEADHASYTQAEYVELLTLTVALQAAVPFFAQHMLLVRPLVGASNMEMYAFQLLADCSIMEKPAMKKLQAFIESTVQAPAAPVADSSHAGFLAWMLAQVIVRRVCVYSLDTQESLITQLHKYIPAKSRSVAIGVD